MSVVTLTNHRLLMREDLAPLTNITLAPHPRAPTASRSQLEFFKSVLRSEGLNALDICHDGNMHARGILRGRALRHGPRRQAYQARADVCRASDTCRGWVQRAETLPFDLRTRWYTYRCGKPRLCLVRCGAGSILYVTWLAGADLHDRTGSQSPTGIPVGLIILYLSTSKCTW